MFDGWSEYFFMIGSSAAALIGLMFIVVTLTAGRDPKQLEQGKHLYTSPIVWHLAAVLVLSGAAIVPIMSPRWFGAVAVCAALLGIAIGLRSAFGIRHFAGSPGSRGFDMFWYGGAPAIIYVVMIAAATAIFTGQYWGVAAFAADLMALLLVSIHAEWDLVTFLAPEAAAPPPGVSGPARESSRSSSGENRPS